MFFVFEAEDGIRVLVGSRGRGEVYKRQPRAREHEAQRPAEMVGDPPHAFGGRDMILPPRLDIGGGFHPRQIDRGAADRQRAGFDQPVVAVEIGQIAAVPARGQGGGFAVPVQELYLIPI